MQPTALKIVDCSAIRFTVTNPLSRAARQWFRRFERTGGHLDQSEDSEHTSYLDRGSIVRSPQELFSPLGCEHRTMVAVGLLGISALGFQLRAGNAFRRCSLTGTDSGSPVFHIFYLSIFSLEANSKITLASPKRLHSVGTGATGWFIHLRFKVR